MEMNDKLCQPHSEEEVEAALHQMHPSKALGPDVFNPFVYQKFWPILGKQVSHAVIHIICGATYAYSLNHTHVVLISKKQNLTEMTYFCPIILCNAVYKLVTKIVTNRVTEFLPSIISYNQSARWLIPDNILVAFEIFRSMNYYLGDV